MSEETENKPEEAAAAATDGPEKEAEKADPEAAEAEPGNEEAEPCEEDMELAPEDLEALQGLDRTVELEAEIADLKDKLLRALAESENVRRRAERDKEDAAKYAIANFARQLLAVSDNLRRALDSIAEGARQEGEALDILAVGVELTERELRGAFDRCGIKPIDALGEKFDHNLHEAMFELEDKDKPAGTVVQVVQTGFRLNERLLRPAKVGVSKGGSKPDQEEAGEGETDSEAELQNKESAQAYEEQSDDKPVPPGTNLDEEL